MPFNLRDEEFSSIVVLIINTFMVLSLALLTGLFKPQLGLLWLFKLILLTPQFTEACDSHPKDGCVK